MKKYIPIFICFFFCNNICIPKSNQYIQQDIQTTNLRLEINLLRARLSSLENTIASYDSLLPTSMNITNQFITDRTANFEITLNTPGKIRAIIKRSGQVHFEKISNEILSNHILRFSNLIPNTNYTLELFILRWNGAVISPNPNQALSFNTNNIITIPSVQVNIIDTTSKIKQPLFCKFIHWPHDLRRV